MNRLRAWLRSAVYETNWPFRAYARRSGERICGREHHRLSGPCGGCGAVR